VKALDISGPMAPYPVQLKEFWYPVAFSDHINKKTMIPLESFEETRVIF
jgi:chlorophyllide a oxygenase